MSDPGNTRNGKVGSLAEVGSQHLQDASDIEHCDHKRQSDVIDDHCGTEGFDGFQIAPFCKQADDQQNDRSQNKQMQMRDA